MASFVRSPIAFILGITLSSASVSIAAQSMSVRFYPERGVYAYPVDSVRNLQGVLVQNIAISNTGKSPVTLESVTLALKGDGTPAESRTLGAADLAKNAKMGAQMKAAGMIDALDLQFGGKAFLGEKPAFAATATLAPGEMILIPQQFLTYRGKRAAVEVRATAREANQNAIAIESALPILMESKNRYRFPLAGTWFIGAGPTAHSHHRWVVPQEFALDIARIGEGWKSFKGDGTKLTDYYAYGAEVLAAADGTVRIVRNDRAESSADLRRPGESQLDYLKRVSTQQDARLAEGGDAIVGNYALIEHEGGESSVYAHLKTGSARVKPGERVRAGQVIGQLGSSGNSTEPHLHFHVCDRPDALRCAGVPAHFDGIEIPYADQPRALQTGDIVVAK
jgi:murein DD-endopeptidase MepM/ murein hydrolase activator NlpD